MDAIKPELQVEMQESEYGTQQPTVMASFDERLVYRMAKAYLYRLAAEIEELSVMEAWVVRVGEVGSLGKGRPHVARVWLELGEGSEAEAHLGITVLGRAIRNLRQRETVRGREREGGHHGAFTS